MRAHLFATIALFVACSTDPENNPGPGSSSGGPVNGGGGEGGSSGDGGSSEGPPTGDSPVIGGCPILPSNNIFNTPIDGLPVHPSSAAFLAKIGTKNLHLDLGRTVDQSSDEYYGIPYNVVKGSSFEWPRIQFRSADPDLDWDPRAEADCAVGAERKLVSPCTAAQAPTPLFPIPPQPKVENGINTAASHLPYNDHHILILDQETCRLWESYHSYPGQGGSWDVFGTATFDLKSNALRPKGWTSSDAAGFPILPLLLRADEASSGMIKHALRFTINSGKIRRAYTWPARHATNNGTTAANEPPMGQLFRIKASYAIPKGFNTQAKVILQALKTYGMYLADGGSDWYITGEPSGGWEDETIAQVQSVSSSNFEAVDLQPIEDRPGWSEDSGEVPPP